MTVAAPRASSTSLRLLVFLRSPNLDRLFAALFEEIVERGHRLEVVVERETVRAPGAGEVLRSLAQRHETFTVSLLPRWPDRWRGARRQLRLAVDVLRYEEPELARASALRERARQRGSALSRSLATLLGRTPRRRARTRSLLLALERRVPLADDAYRFVRERRPDLLLVSPLVSIGSPQADWVRVARALGIPSVLPVASWDNLTNKGAVKEPPDLTLVWNEAQVDEAVRLHGLPRGRVVATGAHSFDQWFEQRPSAPRDVFLRRVGLPVDAPFLLYLASSAFVSGDETQFALEWLARVRRSGDAALAKAGVLFRPHPFNADPWRAFATGDELAVVWPREGEVPSGGARRADYFDSLHHSCAAVGINTSALIEAAIAGRATFTVLTGRYAATQEGVLHFDHLAGESGVLVVARSWDEHLRQLGDAVRGTWDGDDRVSRFVRTFVRPRGLERPAAAVAVDALEALARPQATRAAPTGPGR